MDPGIDGNSSDIKCKKLKFVAIHLGASNSSQDSKTYQDLAKKICGQVMLQDPSSRTSTAPEPSCPNIVCPYYPDDHDNDQDECDSNKINANNTYQTAEDAVVQLVELMENHSSLNCGHGSNLTLNGQVECDSCLMSGKTQRWVGVGAVTECKNPILLAKSLYDHSTVARPLGLVQPNFLVSSGARDWMIDHCMHLLAREAELVSSKSQARYKKYKPIYKREGENIFRSGRCGSSVTSGQTIGPDLSDNLEDNQLDTVGAIAVDCEDNIACAISSGGIVLKYKGRVGQASVPGAGCWAQGSTASITTGVGEYLTTTLFAKLFHDKLKARHLLSSLTLKSDQQQKQQKQQQQQQQQQQQLDDKTIISLAMMDCFEEFHKSPALAHVEPGKRFAGILAVSKGVVDNSSSSGNSPEVRERTHQYHDDEAQATKLILSKRERLYLAYGHSTKCMCIGYMSRKDTSAHSLMSQRKAQGEDPESSAQISVETLELELECESNYTGRES